MNELKPCPFCGGQPFPLKSVNLVCCPDLSCAGGGNSVSAEKWNHRADLPEELPRGTYEPLTTAIIERMRGAGKAGYLDTGNKAFDTLCDMANSSLLYAEEIQRLRSEQVSPQKTTCK